LFDFFPKDFLLILDESHIAIPQLRGMYAGDRARKKSLIEFGFRLPSAFDNRPLRFEEIEQYFKDVIFVSATPGDYEIEHSDQVVEQIIRPTGLLDPEVFVQPRIGQMDHLVKLIKEKTEEGFRSLVMVLTKKLAEELAHYLEEKKIRVCYLHSDLKTPERTELLQKLRLGIFDCLVGVNLLREGIDLPEVALVAIMDADVESFLRDKRSLIQIIGRAARNTESEVVLYADKITKSMDNAMKETARRRMLQHEYNESHGITPQTVKREVKKSITDLQAAIAAASKLGKAKKKKENEGVASSKDEVGQRLIQIERDMQDAAERLDFETAIALRSEWYDLKKTMDS
jgi:excinuclease ABC subunit B